MPAPKKVRRQKRPVVQPDPDFRPRNLPGNIIPQDESSFLLSIQYVVNEYSRQVDKQDDERMYDSDLQTQMLRQCIADIDFVMLRWRKWRKAKKEAREDLIVATGAGPGR